MKLTKRLLAMALAGVMLLTILTGCGGGKTGDRLVEEYLATLLSESYNNIPITHDVPEIKAVADNFKASWLKDTGSWAFSPLDNPLKEDYKALRNIFAGYQGRYSVSLYACEVDSKRSELDQTMRVVSTMHSGLSVYPHFGTPTAAKCATRLVTSEGKSYRIVVLIYDYPVD